VDLLAHFNRILFSPASKFNDHCESIILNVKSCIIVRFHPELDRRVIAEENNFIHSVLKFTLGT